MDSPLDDETVSATVYLNLIARANRYLYITTPYLAIDEPMMRALCLAGDSGVDVRMMMPGIPDHKFAYLRSVGSLIAVPMYTAFARSRYLRPL